MSSQKPKPDSKESFKIEDLVDPAAIGLVEEELPLEEIQARLKKLEGIIKRTQARQKLRLRELDKEVKMKAEDQKLMKIGMDIYGLDQTGKEV